MVACLFIADNPAGNEAGDLAADDRSMLAFDDQSILFVFDGSGLMAGHQKATFAVKHFPHGARDGTAVHVDVEDVEENADSCFAVAQVLAGETIRLPAGALRSGSRKK